VITGRVNPSGKLAETFPLTLRKDLEYPGDGVKIEYNEKLNVGYRYYDKHPEEINFPFGHGLSYTTFEYGNLNLNVTDDKIKISLTLENTGEYDGAEVIQIYAGKEDSGFTRPKKELKAFEKVFLRKGEAKTVETEIPLKELAYFNPSLDEWITEPGKYTIFAGASSRDIRLSEPVTINNEIPYTVDYETVGVGMLQ